MVVYRRTPDRMPANVDEVHEATEEGVRLQWLSTVTGADDGKLTIEKMVLDETGFPQPTGEFEDLEADTLVLALGQESDLSLLRTLPAVRTRDGNVAVDRDMMTDHPGVFAGGDMVVGARTLTDAIGHGKKAAHAIDAWMRGVAIAHPPSRNAGHVRPAQLLVLRRCAEVGPSPSRCGSPYVDLRRGRGWSERIDGGVRGPAVPVMRQLLPVRQLLRRVPRQRGL